MGASLTFTGDFVGAISYFQTTPARLVLPVIALFVTFRLLRNALAVRHRLVAMGIVIGLMSGVALVNNPDYGLSALTAIVVATGLVVRPRTAALQLIGLQFLTVVAVFALYVVLRRLTVKQ